MDTLFLLSSLGGRCLLASSGEKLGVLLNILQLTGQPPKKGFPAPNIGSWGQETPCWSARWHAELSSLCPFSHLVSRTPCLSCLPPASLLCPPVTSVAPLNTSTSKHRCVPGFVLDFILPPSLSPAHTQNICTPTRIPPEFKSWSDPSPPPHWIPGSQMLIVSPWASPSHLKTPHIQKWTPDLSPKTCSPNQPQFVAIPSVQVLREITLQSSLTLLSHTFNLPLGLFTQYIQNLLSPWPKPPSSLDQEHLSGLLTGLLLLPLAPSGFRSQVILLKDESESCHGIQNPQWFLSIPKQPQFL